MGQQQHAHTPSKSLPPHTHIDTHTHNTHQPTTTPIIPPLITDITKMSNNNRSIAWRLPQLLMAILGLVCLTGLLAATPASSSPNTGGRVLLSDVQTLTLHNGRMTTGRRSSPVPQATSIGGTAQGQYTPSSIQCTSKGWDGVDAQWECKADLDNAYRFGETTVVCEGYDYPDDPYILAGSCGVEYTLELTQEGRDIQSVGTGAGAGAWLGGSGGGGGYHSNTNGGYPSNNNGGYPDWGPPPSDSRWNMYNNNDDDHHHHYNHHQPYYNR